MDLLLGGAGLLIFILGKIAMPIFVIWLGLGILTSIVAAERERLSIAGQVGIFRDYVLATGRILLPVAAVGLFWAYVVAGIVLPR
jgi:hypothetical protein